MTTKIIAFYTILGLLVAVSPVLATPNRIPATVSPSGQKVVIPSYAVQVADDVFSLGVARDPQSGRVVEGYAIIHPKDNYAKPPWAGSGNGGSKCYAFLAKGANWKSVEPWVVNPSNSEGLSSDFVASNLASDIQKWEDAAAANILGGGSSTNATLVADMTSPDGSNEVYFGDVSSQGAIAVTIVWGVFAGPPSTRELVEWDMIYDEADFAWSSSGEAGKMDFENIATHELGHAVGMGHPSDSCTEETMYRFAGFGETKKRDLNNGDIAGVNELY